MKTEKFTKNPNHVMHRSSLYKIRRRHVIMKCDCEDDSGSWTGTSDDA